jgi:hypothetical protein
VACRGQGRLGELSDKCSNVVHNAPTAPTKSILSIYTSATHYFGAFGLSFIDDCSGINAALKSARRFGAQRAPPNF